MLKVTTVLLVSGLVLITTLPLQAAEPKNTDEVIAKYLKALGGREKFEAVKTMRIKGKIVIGGGAMEMPMLMEFKRPGKMRSESTFQGHTMIQGYDGKTGWYIMPMMGDNQPHEMPAPQLAQAEEKGDFEGPLVDYKKKGFQVELMGKEQVDGADTYKLKVTDKEGNVQFFFLDAKHFLPIKIKSTATMQGMKIENELDLGDYREVGGIMMAHSMGTKSGPQGGSVITYEKIEINVDIPDQRFAMPKTETKTP